MRWQKVPLPAERRQIGRCVARLLNVRGHSPKTGSSVRSTATERVFLTMLRTSLTAFTLAVFATQAAALSCMRPDIARTYQYAAESEELYSVVMGEFVFDEGALPQAVRSFGRGFEKDVIEIPAHFTGQQLSRSGVATDYDVTVTLEVQCLGQWCGGMASGETAIAFLRHGGETPVLDVTPCGETVFIDPDQAQIATAISCINGGTCGPAG